MSSFSLGFRDFSLAFSSTEPASLCTFSYLISSAAFLHLFIALGATFGRAQGLLLVLRDHSGRGLENTMLSHQSKLGSCVQESTFLAVLSLWSLL